MGTFFGGLFCLLFFGLFERKEMIGSLEPSLSFEELYSKITLRIAK